MLLGILSQAATMDLIPEETSSHYSSYATYYESEIVVKVLGICSVMSDSFFTTPWTVAQQAPLSMGFPRQKD